MSGPGTSVALAAAVLACVVALPVAANASPAGPPPGAKVTTRVVARTTGPELAAAVLAGSKEMDLGSAAGTITITVDGVPHKIGVNMGEFTEALDRDGTSTRGLLEVLAIPTLGAAFLRILRFLSRLGAA